MGYSLSQERGSPMFLQPAIRADSVVVLQARLDDRPHKEAENAVRGKIEAATGHGRRVRGGGRDGARRVRVELVVVELVVGFDVGCEDLDQGWSGAAHAEQRSLIRRGDAQRRSEGAEPAR